MSNSSVRLDQTLAILRAIAQNKPGSLAEVAKYRRFYETDYAEHLGIHRTTAHSKYTAQLGLNVREFDELVWRWTDSSDSALRATLEARAGLHAAELIEIRDFFQDHQGGEIQIKVTVESRGCSTSWLVKEVRDAIGIHPPLSDLSATIDLAP